MEFQGSWVDRLPLIEFSYNNSYHASIGMAPHEALYGRKCRTPLCWSDISETVVIGPQIIEDMTDQVRLIQQRMKAAQDRQGHTLTRSDDQSKFMWRTRYFFEGLPNERSNEV